MRVTNLLHWHEDSKIMATWAAAHMYARWVLHWHKDSGMMVIPHRLQTPLLHWLEGQGKIECDLVPAVLPPALSAQDEALHAQQTDS